MLGAYEFVATKDYCKVGMENCILVNCINSVLIMKINLQAIFVKFYYVNYEGAVKLKPNSCYKTHYSQNLATLVSIG